MLGNIQKIQPEYIQDMHAASKASSEHWKIFSGWLNWKEQAAVKEKSLLGDILPTNL